MLEAHGEGEEEVEVLREQLNDRTHFQLITVKYSYLFTCLQILGFALVVLSDGENLYKFVISQPLYRQKVPSC